MPYKDPAARRARLRWRVAHESKSSKFHVGRRTNKLKSYLCRTYGMSIDEYEQMVVAQKGVCAICGKSDKRHRLSIDHCHITKKVRKLLCGDCNRGLGLFRDAIVTLRAAANYLESFT